MRRMAGPIQPVVLAIRTPYERGGSVMSVYLRDEPPAGEKILAGAALPVRFIAASELVHNGGPYQLDGGPALPITIVPSEREMEAGHVTPIYAINGRAFYVDATHGDDDAIGLSPETAWKTIAKINTFSGFEAGDRILLKRGETWTGTTLVPPRDGLSFAPYGVGPKPIIDGNDVVNCVYVSGKEEIAFQGIEVTQGLDAGFYFHTSGHCTLLDCDAHDCGNDNVLFITGCHDCLVEGGEFYDAYERVPGSNVTGLEVTNGCYGIVLRDLETHHNTGSVAGSGMGISVHSHTAQEMPYDILIDGVVSHDNSSFGLFVWKQDNTADTDRNIRLTDCHSYANDEGIRVSKSAPALNYPTGVGIDHCHLDGNATRAIYVQGDEITVTRNTLEGKGQMQDTVNLRVVNNVMYFPVGAGTYPQYYTGARTAGLIVKNNIVVSLLAGGMMIGVDALVTNPVDIDYNLYYLIVDGVGNTRWHWRGTAYNWANWLSNSGQDANSPAADQDPLFVDPANDDFVLQAGSPAINAGVEIVGITDGYLGPAPDCGAYEKA